VDEALNRTAMAESMTEPLDDTPRRPVIVVHGYLASKEMMIPMRSKLAAEGFDAHIAQLPPLLLGKVEPMAGLLASEVDRITGRSPDGQCDLVGVSLGGLLGLRYLQRFDEYQRVRRFVTVGTPFRGSRAARAATLLLGRISPAARQLLPGSSFIETLIREGLPPRVQALSICATRDSLAPSPSCVLDGAENVELLGPPPPMTHQALVVSGEVSKLMVDFLRGDPTPHDVSLDPESQAAIG